MADQLAPNVDLVVWLDIPTLTFPTDRATELLEVATGWVQAATGQKLLAVSNETITFPFYPGRNLWLPERPVTSVGTVTMTDAFGTVYPRTLNVDYSVRDAEVRWLYWFGWPFEKVTVTYSHGYATAPQAVRGVVLSAASRIAENPAGLRSETIGGVSWSMAGDSTDVSGAGLTASELHALAPYMALAA